RHSKGGTMNLGIRIFRRPLKAPDSILVVIAIAVISAAVAIITPDPISGMAAAVSLLYAFAFFVWAFLLFVSKRYNRARKEKKNER
ncbi:MAG TPA: hypothetical protein VMV71_00415, partial [Candidatus Paceibacterota bacterium]|nr:hypothetical protein [Candidatus Paceibacterota bacterium]